MILHGDCLDELKKLENDSIDLVCTDPPYGYSFMGKDWDKAVPSVEVWQECLRVLKPGAFCFVMSAPRSDVQAQMISRLTFAGFRVDFTPIYWTYASGFPKAGNIGKLVDKRNGQEPLAKAFVTAGKGERKDLQDAKQTLKYRSDYGYKHELRSDQAKALDGSYAGFQPKPAVEVVLVAMKPLSEKTFVDQAMKNGKGITWLDDVRVPIAGNDFKGIGGGCKLKVGEKQSSVAYGDYEARVDIDHSQGRFPANLLVSDDVLNDGRVSKTGGRSGGHERWDKSTKEKNINTYGDYKGRVVQEFYGGDSGSYSRYFDIDKWWSERIKDLPESVRKTFPFLIVPKAGKAEKNKGMDDMPDKEQHGVYAQDEWSKNNMGNTPQVRAKITKNHHPTVKPLKLMSYLVTLGSRPGDTVLDPFVGSGTTCLAAESLNRKSVGIEREQEYVEIAQSRLSAITNQPKLV